MKNEIVYELELLIITAAQLQRVMSQIGAYVDHIDSANDATVQYNQAMLKNAIALMDYTFDINLYVMFVKTMIEFVSIADVAAYQELIDRASLTAAQRIRDFQNKFDMENANESRASVCQDTGGGEGSNNAGGDLKSN